MAAKHWMHLAAAFELLSLAFLPPRREVAEALVSGEFEAACNEGFAGAGCSRDSVHAALEQLAGCGRSNAEAVYHELRREHAYLFAVCRSAPRITPYVGVWAAQRRGQEGLLFVGKESVAIERFMRECGAAKNLDAGQSNDPVDHVGTVCEFLKYLCLVNARAVRAPEGCAVAEGDFDTFVRDHFADYARWCSSQVLDTSRIRFYKAMALLLFSVVEELSAEKDLR